MKLKLRKIGNSLGVLIPAKELKGYNIGDVIELNVITKGQDVITKKDNVITIERDVITKTANVITEAVFIPQTKKRWYCHKHKQWNDECGCV